MSAHDSPTDWRARSKTMHDYLLLSEVAEIARTSIDSVRGWLRSGRLPSVKPGRRRLVRREELERFLARDGLTERRAVDAEAAGTE